MNKFKDYILKNKPQFGLATLGLLAVGGLIYWFTKKPKNQQIQKQTINIPQRTLKQSQITNTQTVEQHEQEEIVISVYNKKLSQIINQIKRIFSKTNDQITPQAITAIIQGQYTLARDQVKVAMLKSKIQRRQKLEDPLQYANIITKHQLELQQLQQKHLGVILARFNIDKVTWKDANQQWQSKCQEDDEGISDLIRRQEQKQLLSLLPAQIKPKDIKFVLKILQKKLQILKNLNPDELGVRLGTDQAARYQMIETYINDLIHKQFKVEPQELQFSIQQFSKQNKLKVIQYQDQIINMINDLIYLQEDDKQAQDEEFN